VWPETRFAGRKSTGLTNDYFSLRFNSHFPIGSGLANTRMSPFWILLELRMMEVVVTNGAIRCAKLQSKHHHQQTNTQLFTGMPFPVAQPTMSKHWRKLTNDNLSHRNTYFRKYSYETDAGNIKQASWINTSFLEALRHWQNFSSIDVNEVEN